MLGGVNTIRDFIAFPKNNQGRDVMIDAPSPIHGGPVRTSFSWLLRPPDKE